MSKPLLVPPDMRKFLSNPQPAEHSQYITRNTLEDELASTAAEAADSSLPAAPTGLTLTYDSKQAQRHARLRAIVEGDVVTQTEGGLPLTSAIDHYTAQLLTSTDAGATWLDKKRRKVVDAKDADTDTTWHATFHAHIRTSHWYKARARAVDKQGNRSAWTAYTTPGPAVDPDAVPAVTGLVKDNSIARRIKWTWTDPNDDITTRWRVRVYARGELVEGPVTVRHARYVYRVGEADKGIAHTIKIVPLSDIDTEGDEASLDATEDGTIDGDILTPGTVDITPFASSIRPVAIVATLPGLPDANYPVGACVVLTTNGKLYRNVSGAWSAATPTSDLTGTISAGQIAANAIIAGKIAANAVTAGTIAAGAVSATEIAAHCISADQIAVGGLTAITITASLFRTDTSGSYITIDGTGDKDKVKFTSGGATTALVATGGGIQLGATTSQKLGFFGASTITRPTVTGVKSGGTALTSVINKLANLGLIQDSTT